MAVGVKTTKSTILGWMSQPSRPLKRQLLVYSERGRKCLIEKKLEEVE